MSRSERPELSNDVSRLAGASAHHGCADASDLAARPGRDATAAAQHGGGLAAARTPPHPSRDRLSPPSETRIDAGNEAPPGGRGRNLHTGIGE